MPGRLGLLLSFFLSAAILSNGPVSAQSQSRNAFFHAEGKNIVDGGGGIFRIKSVTFANNIWSRPNSPAEIFNQSKDYSNAAALGFNTVQLFLRYSWFENESSPFHYRKEGFEWLDQQIRWAKENGLFVILDLAYPQGGNGSEFQYPEFWETGGEKQSRFKALWKELASYYSTNSVVLGYNILDFPHPMNSLDEWKKLAGETVRVVREADPNHMIIVSRVEEVGYDLLNDNINGDMNFFKLEDPNVLYQMRFIKPYTFTFQGIRFAPPVYGIIGFYPDEAISEVAGNMVLVQSVSNSRGVPLGWRDWFRFESEVFTVTNEKARFGVPVAQGSRLDFLGSVLFDDITIEEFEPEGKKTMSWFCDMESNDSWLLIPGKNYLDYAPGVMDPFGGLKGSRALKVSGPNGSGAMNGIFHLFPVKNGYSYKISGWMKTFLINKAADVQLRLDFYGTDGSVMTRNRRYIQAEIGRILAWREKADVPVYIGMIRLSRYAVEYNRGGVNWLSDMLDICRETGTSYNYSFYADTYTGLILEGIPGYKETYQNEALTELFLRKQKP